MLVILVIVSVPTAVVAAWKLARRDLSSILEGCGWAINARMRLNRRQRQQFTRSEPYPADAAGTPRKRWLLAVLLAVLAVLVVLAAVEVLAPAEAFPARDLQGPAARAGTADAAGAGRPGCPDESACPLSRTKRRSFIWPSSTL